MKDFNVEKLDVFSKVLLATSTINYMANACNGVLVDYKNITNAMQKKDPENSSLGILNESATDKAEVLQELLKKLCEAIEDMGNYLDGNDIVCPIDARVYEVPLNILLHGKDEIETEVTPEVFDTN